jgi:hypothetical protein
MMNRLILAAVSGFSLTAFASYLPSFEFLRSAPAPEQLRIDTASGSGGQEFTRAALPNAM